ncbi:MAG: hypothetical protein U1E14_02170 [Geminicoccaceae bacterium]
MGMIVNWLLGIAGGITALFVSRSATNFFLLQAAVALLVGVAIVGILVFLGRRR